MNWMQAYTAVVMTGLELCIGYCAFAVVGVNMNKGA